MTLKRITERVAFSGGKVLRDGERPYIPDVVICGFDSANGRTYRPEAWAGDRVKRYENRPVYVNHANTRAAESKIGWFEQVHVRPDGKPAGRFYLNPKHPLYESVAWAAEHKPDFYGMSHVANCKTKYEGGREIVEEVVDVESIDLVGDPATTHSLYESRGAGAVTLKLKEYLDRLAPRLGVKQLLRARRLTEDDMGVADAPMAADAPAPDDAATDPDEAIDSAFGSALHAQIDAYLEGTLDQAALIGKIKTLCKAHGDASGEKGGGGEGEGKGEGEAEESKKKAADPWALLKECREEGFTPSDLQLRALTAFESREDRTAYIREQKLRVAEEKPKSGGRDRGTAKVTEQKGASGGATAEAPPDDPKQFGKWVTEPSSN